MNACTFSDDKAAASSVGVVGVGGDFDHIAILPFTETGISISLSISNAGSNLGQGA